MSHIIETDCVINAGLLKAITSKDISILKRELETKGIRISDIPKIELGSFLDKLTDFINEGKLLTPYLTHQQIVDALREGDLRYLNLYNEKPIPEKHIKYILPNYVKLYEPTPEHSNYMYEKDLDDIYRILNTDEYPVLLITSNDFTGDVIISSFIFYLRKKYKDLYTRVLTFEYKFRNNNLHIEIERALNICKELGYILNIDVQNNSIEPSDIQDIILPTNASVQAKLIITTHPRNIHNFNVFLPATRIKINADLHKSRLILVDYFKEQQSYYPINYDDHEIDNIVDSIINLCPKNVEDKLCMLVKVLDSIINTMRFRPITSKDIEETLKAFVRGITNTDVDINGKLKYDDIHVFASRMKENIFGQEDAINSLINATKRSYFLRASDRNKPIGVFLFAGPTGVGKTHTAKTLASSLFHNNNSLLVYDMSEYRMEHELARLIGSPAGYIGHDSGGKLVKDVMSKPRCVILFDEIEKAHYSIQNIMLQIFDEGRLTDGKGNVANFNETIIIMTTNLGATNEENKIDGFNINASKIEYDNNMCINAIRRHFTPEFRNRLTEIIYFNTLDDKSVYRIIERELSLLVSNIKHTVDINIEYANIIDYIKTNGYIPQYGGRSIKRFVETRVLDIIISKYEKGDRNIVLTRDDFIK